MKIYFVDFSGIGYFRHYLVQAENKIQAIKILEEKIGWIHPTYQYLKGEERLEKLAQFCVKEIPEGQVYVEVFDMDDPNYEG